MKYLSGKSCTIDDVMSDPYQFTFKEMSEIVGKHEAVKWFSTLYKRNLSKKHKTICKKNVLKDGDTSKYIFELSDGRCIETVCIKRRDGITVCVSTQVGCAVGCIFCESGSNGFVRNLTPSEIVQQVVLLNEKVNRIIFMGMGEPLYNYDALIKALHILRDRNGVNFPTDGITVSTVAPIKELKKLREEHMKLQLTISLHATSQRVRDMIMPNMCKNDINKTIEEAVAYSLRHNRKIVVAYLLLPGINDKASDVEQLGRWLCDKNVMINVLEYNTTSNDRINRVNKQELIRFKQRLENIGLDVVLRQSHGGKIRAACGQLVSQYNKK